MGNSDNIERRLKLHDLRVLMQVAQAGSMLRAARRLNTSQPAISRSIAELEHSLGVRLLDRSRQGVEPTIYGRVLLDGATAVFDDLSQAVKNIEFLADPTEGELRIGCDFPYAAGMLPKTISRFRRQFSRIDVHVKPLFEVSHQYRALRERSCELNFGRLEPPVERDLEVEVLFQDELVVVAGSNNPWTRRRKLKLADLEGEPWLLPTLDTVTGPLIAQVFQANGLDFRPKGVTTGFALLQTNSLVASGDFLAFFPSSLLRVGTLGLGLKALPVSLPIPRSSYGIMRLKNRALSRVAQLFIECAREVVKPLAQGSIESVSVNNKQVSGRFQDAETEIGKIRQRPS
jgi:DNA-binding transcriptional LysR family regulator